MDEHNRELLTNAHPLDWKNPTPADRYNMVVVGAGPAGLVTAAGVAGLGGTVALVERYLFGGDCLNFGCVPSKTLIAAARAAADVRRADRYGIELAFSKVDFAAVMERVRRIRGQISHHDAVQKFQDMGIDVFLGDAAFTGQDTVEVEGQALRFARACIATGARAVRPDIEGLAEAGFHTNESIFSLTELPPRLAVLGSGPLGCELAQAFARLGSEVTIIERSGQFLKREDRDAADIVGRSFMRDGIHCVFNSQVKRVTGGTGGKQLLLVSDGKESSVEVDAILVGYGRAPNVDGLGLEAAGVAYDARHGVNVDDRLRTTNKRIYAAGDVCLKHKFTHTADATARIVIQNALFWGRKKLSALTIPWCTYTDPEVAHVGLYEHEAKERGLEVDTFTKPFKDNDRAVTEGEDEGFVRIHVKKGSDRIVGATIVGRHAGEMISELSVAMAGKVGLSMLANVIHPYPTLSEAIKGVGDMYSHTRLTPLLKKLFVRILAWRR
ncbi:MAG TPA: mercuric reductase [Phycisphaerae bacterium]|nr:mercuric reductase [Phycisphaerae bacterium]HDZ45182.1 mercuric reductase [Phycisphaerae bacterium]